MSTAKIEVRKIARGTGKYSNFSIPTNTDQKALVFHP